MANEENDETITVTKAEWADVIRIMKEDGLHIHKTYAAFMKSQEKPKEGEENPQDDKEGSPPPKKEEENEPPKKKGLWWGNSGDE